MVEVSIIAHGLSIVLGNQGFAAKRQLSVAPSVAPNEAVQANSLLLRL
jgi:hypothetical protein